MSLAATTRAYSCRPRDATSKLVLIRLADFADESAVAPIMAEDLAEFAMCSRNDIETVVRGLHDDGFIEIQPPLAGIYHAFLVGVS